MDSLIPDWIVYNQARILFDEIKAAATAAAG
jgi:hypothetical protein